MAQNYTIFMTCSATEKDIDSLLEITSACALHMQNQSIFQWNALYPSKETFEEDLKRKELFVFKLDTKPIGCIVISTFMDDEYKEVNWLTPNENNVYIHRLAVHPEQQGKGIARKLMAFAEEKSRLEKRTSVRLDTFSQNLRNQKFYEQRGYQRLGAIYIPQQSEFPFYCYELIL